MRQGDKENKMTVAAAACERLGKRQQCDEGEFAMASHSLKKLRVLEPLQAPTCASLQPTAAITTSGTAEHNNATKAPKKRSRAAVLECQEPSCTSPAAGKRGKRADGSNSSAFSPRASAAAIEQLLTCEGLEKDPDLEVQHAYVLRQLQQLDSRQQQRQVAGGAGARVSAAAAAAAAAAATSESDTGGADSGKDAAKSSRGRDQAQHRSRDQLPSRHRAVEVPAALRSPSPEPEDSEPRVCLDLVADKEWQRLFAVLSINSSQPKQDNEEQQQEQVQAGHSSASSTAAAAAATATHVVQVEPVTPTRRESSPHAAAADAAASVTPARRSFLATEFTRVQARLTPERQHQQRLNAMEVMC